VVTGTHLYSSYNFKEGISPKIKELKFTERVGSEESHCIKNSLLRYLDTAVTMYICILARLGGKLMAKCPCTFREGMGVGGGE
jgi:hypothetical protein